MLLTPATSNNSPPNASYPPCSSPRHCASLPHTIPTDLPIIFSSWIASSPGTSWFLHALHFSNHRPTTVPLNKMKPCRHKHILCLSASHPLAQNFSRRPRSKTPARRCPPTFHLYSLPFHTCSVWSSARLLPVPQRPEYPKSHGFRPPWSPLHNLLVAQ